PRCLWCKAASGAHIGSRRSTGTRSMTLWFVFALMTAAAIFAVLWPLGRAGHPPRPDSSETVVYRDQLAEIDRDVAAGLINPPAAGAARVEISRRLLAAVDHRREAAGSNVRLRRVAAVVALLGLPVVAVGLYFPLG